MNDIDLYNPKLFVWILISIYWIILTPITAYHAYQFYLLKCREIPFFRKRHPNLVLVNVAIWNLYPLLFRPIGDFIVLYQLLPRFHPISVLMVNIIQIYPIFAALRLWLLYYDYNHARQSLLMKWKTQITHDKELPFILRVNWIGDFHKLSLLCTTIGLIFFMVIMLS